VERIGTDEGRVLSIGERQRQVAGALSPEGSAERTTGLGLLQVVAMSGEELIASCRRFRALACGPACRGHRRGRLVRAPGS